MFAPGISYVLSYVAIYIACMESLSIWNSDYNLNQLPGPNQPFVYRNITIGLRKALSWHGFATLTSAEDATPNVHVYKDDENPTYKTMEAQNGA